MLAAARSFDESHLSDQPRKRESAYADAALTGALNDLRQSVEGSRNTDLNKHGYRLFKFVGRGLIDHDTVVQELEAAGRALGLPAHEVRSTIKSAARAGMRDAHVLNVPDFEQDTRATTNGRTPTAIVESVERVTTITPKAPLDVNDMLATEYPPLVWYAPGFLREGLGILIGAPNVGKTPLAVQLAIALATGGKWMNQVQCPQVPVLYLGVEYSAQELVPLIKESSFRTQIPRGYLFVKTIEDDFPTTPEAAIAELEWYITEYNVRVIIIDVLTAFLPPEKFKQNVYRGDYAELKPYHQLALRHNCAIVGTWHASKREADPKLMYNGSTGMWAVPASRMTLYQDQEQRVRLASFPRMSDKIDYALTQEKSIWGRRWVVADAAPDPMMSAQELVIYRWLKEHSDKANPKTPATIAEMTSTPNSSIRTVLGRMFDKNLVQRGIGNGYFVEPALVTSVTAVTPVQRVALVTDVTLQNSDFVTGLSRADSASESDKTQALQMLQRDSVEAISDDIAYVIDEYVNPDGSSYWMLINAETAAACGTFDTLEAAKAEAERRMA